MLGVVLPQTHIVKWNFDISMLSAIGTRLFTVNNITMSNAYCLQKSSVTLHTYPCVPRKVNCSASNIAPKCSDKV
jgi:hypothetical protein